jgi:plasmid replication initiation protein
MTEKEKRNLVVKRNDLIQNARYTMPKNEQKILAYLISKVDSRAEVGHKEFYEQEWQVKDIMNFLGLRSDGGANYKIIKDAIKGVADQSRWVDLIGDGTETLCRWIDRAVINSRSGVIKIKLDKDMMPYLLELNEHFTEYQIGYILQMRSEYSIRLYELLKSYENEANKEKNKGKIEIDLEILKSTIGATAPTHSKYANFKQAILDKTCDDINRLTDLKVSFAPIKEAYSGRKVNKIEFKIEKQTKQNTPTKNSSPQTEKDIDWNAKPKSHLDDPQKLLKIQKAMNS